MWDLEKEVVHRSDEVYRMVGCEPGAFGTEPEAWLQFVLPEDVPALDEAFAKARNGGADYHMEYRVRWPDGSLHWLESQGKCQLDAQGKAMRIFGVMADISQRKQAEEAMLRAEKLAVAGRLAASVAHEINNPLEAVANMLYLITICRIDRAGARAGIDALDELMRISLVAQSTLKFHRESGAAKTALLSEVLDSVLTMFRGKLQSMDIAVQMKAETGTSDHLHAQRDSADFRQSDCQCDRSHAIQGDGLWCASGLHGTGGSRHAGMRVTICDTGSGIDRATAARIFEPFFTTKSDTGTGLGLWVVAQLIERHEGAVRVWSSQRPGAQRHRIFGFSALRRKNVDEEIHRRRERNHSRAASQRSCRDVYARTISPASVRVIPAQYPAALP